MNSNTGLSAAKLALAIKRRLDEENGTPLTQSDPIAIVGIGCRFPGNVKSPDDYWQLLLAGTDTIREVPSTRWSISEWYDPDPQAVGKTNGRFGSFLDGVDEFDPAFFGLAPREAPFMDPQQRLLLEVTWEALWEAGIAPHKLAGSQTSVFLALCNTDYSRLLLTDPYSIGASSLTGASHSIASGRISYLLDLQGPSVSIDTACSSSLVAVHLACQSLRSGESRLALAGGATLHLTHEHYVALAKLGMLAPDGRCKTFDSHADGFVPGEGCGVIVLKRLADALIDGDRIHAVIRGTATAQDGRTTVLTAPNGLAQQNVVRAALDNARIGPEQIGYVETHGTGTALGDPIEVEALSEVLGGAAPVALGAVKTNLGHLEAAAGIAGLIKATLSLEHEAIPPNLHFGELNAHISFDGTQFFLPKTAHSWPRTGIGRFAGVSSFGFGGTNAHVVLEEAPHLPQQKLGEGATGRSYLLPISARSPEALTEFARRYQDLFATTASIADVCRAAAVRRSHYEERLAVTGSTAEALTAGLQDLIDGRTRSGASRGSAVEDRGVVFVCSGQGSQWARMGVSLIAQYPAFREAIDECDTIIRTQAGWSLREQLEADDATSRLSHTEYAQPAIVATEIALARLWESWGVVPVAVVGHSVGEIAAAHIAGAIGLEETMRIVLHRGRLMERATGHGRMAAVALTAEIVQSEIARFGDALAIAAINSPQSVVISGEPATVEGVMAEWSSRGVNCRSLPVDYAFHSAQMEPYRDELVRVLGRVATRATSIPMISTVTGDEIDGFSLDAAYWGVNIRQPVRLGDAVQRAIAKGARTFVEIGPHAVLSLSVQECLAAERVDGVVLPSLRRGQDERTTMFAALGTLYTRGASVEWTAVYPGAIPVVPLPVYPYQRRRHWIQRSTAARSVARNAGPLLGRRVQSPLLSGVGYEIDLSIETLPFLADHRIGGATILPMTAFLEMVLEAVADSMGDVTVVLKETVLSDVVIHKPLIVPDTGTRTVQLFLEGTRFRIFSLANEQWTLHAEGQFETAVSSENQLSKAPAIPSNTVDAGEHYRRAWAGGAHFGQAFQTIVKLASAGNVAAATVRLNVSEAADAWRYRIHPALLDGCFQSVLATDGMSDAPVWVPIAIDRLVVQQVAGAEVRSVLTTRDSTGSGETLAADVWIMDTSGRTVATVNGLRCKRTHASIADPTAKFRYQVTWRACSRSNQSCVKRAGQWLLVGDLTGVSGALRQALEGRGESCVVVPVDGVASLANIIAYRGVVHLASLDKTHSGGTVDTIAALDADIERGCRTTLTLVQALVQHVGELPRMWIVTRGAHAVTPDDSSHGFSQAGLLGLARTVAMEHPELVCTTIDLDHTSDVASLVDELLYADGEDCVAIRGGGRYVARLTHDVAQETTSLASETPRRLSVSARGTLDNLQFEPLERHAPGAGEVEIAVEAASLNFRDVLNALGMYPGNAGQLGAEFAGRIERVGVGVTRWTPGDRVMGIAWGSFADYVTTPSELVTNIPAGLDAIAAATLPNAFLTAYYCLLRIAGLKAGERVLIHAGAGGVGMAAIQVAMYVGAEIFTTAGNPDKRAYLRELGVQHVLDSRTLDFSRQILEITGGEGVDVVLNSLAGDFIAASFAALAPRGRFVEIGKIGTWTDAQVEALGKQIEYTVVDLGVVIEEQPAILGEQLDEIGTLVSAGSLRTLPYRVFSFDDAQAAFRYMAQSRHTGRVILKLERGTAIQSDATYLITGGLGGIGLRTARWLVECGARHVLLVGRSSPSAEACAAIETMKGLGATVTTHAVDVADRAAVETLLQTIRQSMPPLRGIVHAAGVLDDGVLMQQTWERFQAVLAPKVHGAWHLHDLTRETPLDFFVMCSSVSAVLGAPGQGAYAASNALLDAIAVHRHSQGRAGSSINWGAWADVGMAARVETYGKRRVLDAIRPMSPDDCVACLEQSLRSLKTQTVVLDANWSAWTGHVPSVLADLASVSTGPTQAAGTPARDTRPDIVQQLAKAPDASKRSVLIGFINQEARHVLGLSDTHPIDERQPLLKLGLDSLMAVELRNRLAAALGQPLPATILFDYPSPAALADVVLGSSTQTKAPVAHPAPVADNVLQDIAAMSDEEAELLLARELGTA